ncbi:hypothetical protein HNR27_000973 [Ornithinibacillus bavariensis]
MIHKDERKGRHGDEMNHRGFLNLFSKYYIVPEQFMWNSLQTVYHTYLLWI